MKKIFLNNYHILIQHELNYAFDSSDNKYYDQIFNLVEQEYYTQTISLHIEKDDWQKTIALIVPYHTDVNSCVLPAGNGLFFMLNDLLCLFNLETMEIDKQKKIDTIGTMFAPFSYKQDFILYGEMDIFRIASDLSVQWKFSGRDIFVRYQSDDSPAFEMKKDRICLYDFEDNYYEISYEGILIG